uniref:Malate dehydrogenase, cytoplasmic n=1 Tax=Cyprinus carpio TaxID=7962 RepID=A0A8C2FA73_CYPCA
MVMGDEIFLYPSVSYSVSLSYSFTEVIPTDKVEVGFKDLDAAILVGSMPRKEGMERKDLLKANVAIFKTQGEALEKYAKKTVKVQDCNK